MRRVKVKICGVRTLEEAEAAIEGGADALGFNFWPKSPRYIYPEEAARITDRIRPAFAVGVFVNEERSRILEIASVAGLDAVQLHGDESPEFCSEFGPLEVIKALRVSHEFEVGLIKDYPASAVLLDAAVKGIYGGTGKSFNWEVARKAKRYAPIILAGGLTVDNIARAILEIRPAAVDVCSGVESSPGCKDLNKLRELLKETARANALIEPESEDCSSEWREGVGEFINVFGRRG